MDEPKPTPETIDYKQKMIFGFYEPENERKIELRLLVDCNNIVNPLRKAGYEELEKKIVDLASNNNKHEERYHYVDSASQDHEIILTVNNDGQTQTILLQEDNGEEDGDERLLDERLKLSVIDQK